MAMITKSCTCSLDMLDLRYTSQGYSNLQSLVKCLDHRGKLLYLFAHLLCTRCRTGAPFFCDGLFSTSLFSSSDDSELPLLAPSCLPELPGGCCSLSAVLPNLPPTCLTACCSCCGPRAELHTSPECMYASEAVRMVDLLMVGDRGGLLRPVLGNAIKDFTLSDLSCKQICNHDIMTLCTLSRSETELQYTPRTGLGHGPMH